MSRETLLICSGALLLSMLLTGLVRAIARSHRVLDLPNARSSHSVATPRGGGIAVVAVMTLVLLVFGVLGMPGSELRLALLVGGIAVALVGFLDDRYTLPAGIRLTVHAAAAAWALWCLGGLPPLRIGDHLVNLGWGGEALGLATIMWALNLFNFMDGVDGIAALEAMFVACAGALLSLVSGVTPAVPAVALAFAAACCGFLVWNWPPARIFMGDVGSGYMGYVIVVLAVAAARENPVALWVWLILGGVFFVDATVTLLRRMLRGERVHEAHRSHAYQWLARRWGSHAKVTLAVLAVNLGWLLPWAMAAIAFPNHAVMLVLVALVPLAALAVACGSGRAETSTAAR